MLIYLPENLRDVCLLDSLKLDDLQTIISVEKVKICSTEFHSSSANWNSIVESTKLLTFPFLIYGSIIIVKLN